MKVCEVHLQDGEKRVQSLSSFLKDSVAKEIVPVAFNLDSFDTEIEKLKQEFDCIRIPSLLSEKILKHLDQNYVYQGSIQSLDYLLRDEKGWWPKHYIDQAFKHLLLERYKNLEINSSALVVCDSPILIQILSSLITLGFKKVLASGQSIEEVEKFVGEVCRVHFNCDLEVVPREDITTLPGENSLVVNALDLSPEKTVIKELYYCNFLKKNGIVVDFNLVPKETPLIKISQSIHARTLPGFEVQAYFDYFWCKKVLGFEIDLPEYSKSLEGIYSNMEFPYPELLDLNKLL